MGHHYYALVPEEKWAIRLGHSGFDEDDFKRLKERLDAIDPDEFYDISEKLDELSNKKISELTVSDLAVLEMINKHWYTFCSIICEESWSFMVSILIHRYEYKIVYESENIPDDYTVIT